MTASSLQSEICFGPYILEIVNARLLRDDRPVALTPKALDVLHYLAARPGRLVTKEELLAALWADVVVSDASIKVCVGEIRRALGDGVKTPVYIQTVHRRGYRFIAPIRQATAPREDEVAAKSAAGSLLASAPATSPSHHATGLDEGVRQWCEVFEAAGSGRRPCVLISVNSTETRIFVFAACL